MDVPRIHQDTIAEVKDRLDITDIVSDHVVLRKRGKDLVGLCPFHDEKTPSFTVSPSKQMYYCFGCGAGGSGISFLMEIGKQSFGEVILELAHKYQIPVKTSTPEEHQEFQRQLSLREQLYEILAVAASFYQHMLRQPEGEKALRYVRETRRLSEETIQQFGLGYAPGGWETLYRYLVETKRYSVLMVEKAGLVRQRKKGEGVYDYFRDRLMIPICDTQGRVIGFGSRTLGDDEPKYLNSPETEVFSKGKTLFGLDRAKTEISRQDCAVVVEGYFDAIALHAAGISNAVAALGTAFSQEQLKQLSRYTESKQVIFNFDADNAGIKATQRAIGEVESLVYSGQVQLRILNLPGGKDADEFLLSSPDAVAIYYQHLQDAPLWIDWQLQQLVKDQDLRKADSFQRVSQEMIKLLNHIENPQRRDFYVKKCAEILSQGDGKLTPVYSKDLFVQLKKPKRKATHLKQRKDRNLLQNAEELLLLIYLHCPEYREHIIEALEERDLLFVLPHHRFLWQQVLQLEQAGKRDLIAGLQEIDWPNSDHAEKVRHLFYLTEKKEEDIARPVQSIKAAIAAIERVTYEKHLSYCLEKWKVLDSATESEKRKYYFQEFQNAAQKIQLLDQERQFTLVDIIDY
ncbi:DNA primase [Spirulina sp. CS-785/01]|uniref:DNA primase n=1 Tax=Spirulina sp. CS-785/01 TaxID=3021716 RepID=UPI00232C4C50|nr:DNA primase [Spirulina sp. CS-785/01]MDB9312416.1 DNA primase [Spirulina sp. CS-785/01]